MDEGWLNITDFGLNGARTILSALGENGYPELA
jgi:hypothetical protein